MCNRNNEAIIKPPEFLYALLQIHAPLSAHNQVKKISRYQQSNERFGALALV